MTEEQRAERVHHHMYDTCEGIAEHAERIVALEELAGELWRWCPVTPDYCAGVNCPHYRVGAEEYCALDDVFRALDVPREGE